MDQWIKRFTGELMSKQIHAFLDSAEEKLKIDYLPKVLKEGLTSTPPRNKFHKVFANCSA